MCVIVGGAIFLFQSDQLDHRESNSDCLGNDPVTVRTGGGNEMESAEGSVASANTTIALEQKEKAFAQLQKLVVNQKEETAAGKEEVLPPGVLARFDSIGGLEQMWVAEDFSIRADDLGNIVAPNPAQGFEADFSDFAEEGVEVRSGYHADPLRIQLKGIRRGREGVRQAGSSTARTEVEGNRVAFDRGDGVTEWYVNRKEGLEQGWTIERPLQGGESDELRFEVEIGSGEMRARFRGEDLQRGSDDQAVVFYNDHGWEAWRYGKLKVLDAKGREIRSWMEWQKGEAGENCIAELVVMTGGAKYPLTVDPVVSSSLGSFQHRSAGSNPKHMIDFNGSLVFWADDGSTGIELWISDGTAEGTRLLKDIVPGYRSSIPEPFTECNGKLYFVAEDEVHGKEPWVTDGTTSGTHILKDIKPGPDDSSSSRFTKLGEKLIFSTSRELWVSDGSLEGTQLLEEIDFPRYFREYNGELYFEAQTSNGYTQLYATDGTPDSTRFVSDFGLRNGSSYPIPLLEFNGKLYLEVANLGSTVVSEIWVSDGTSQGTEMLVDRMSSPPVISNSSLLTEAGGKLYFRAIGSLSAPELWISDGTSEGTSLLKRFSGSNSDDPSQLTALNGLLVFRAHNSSSTPELWVSDGTAEGTQRIESTNLNVNSLFNSGNRVFFRGGDGNYGSELWSTDGTSGGTQLVKDINNGRDDSVPGGYAEFGGEVYFYADDGSTGTELWKTDGTANGTVMVRDINPGSGLFYPDTMAAIGERLLFVASGQSSGKELWVSDGTVSGTQLVRDIHPGPASSSPRHLTAGDGKVFFEATDGIHGVEVWSSDGTTNGTQLVKDIREGSSSSFPQNLTEVSGTVFFSADDGSTAGRELWKSDGFAGGTVLVKDIREGQSDSTPLELTSVDGKVVFTADDSISGREPWVSDGTLEGTRLLKDTRPGGGYSYVRDFLGTGDRVYFRANDADHGTELWVSDGTPEGTHLEVDIDPDGSSSPVPRFFSGNSLYLEIEDEVSGTELWVSDGTFDGTELLKDIYPGTQPSSPLFLTELGNQIVFSAHEPSGGTELWSSNGTPEGTDALKDILPGSESSHPESLTMFGTQAYFRADDGVHGSELWSTDGTPGGTQLFEDLLPGPEGSRPGDFYVIGNILFFSSRNSDGGRDLRMLYDLPALKINEFDPTPQIPGREFLEIFSADGKSILEAFTVVFFDGATDASVLAVDLEDQLTNEEGYFLIGNGNIPNVDMVIPNGSFSSNIGAVALYRDDADSFPNGTPVTSVNLVDALVFDKGGQDDDSGLLALLNEGEPQLDESLAGNAIGHSFQRLPNGTGGVRNTSIYSVLSPTPGVANELPPAPSIELLPVSDTGVSSSDNITKDTTPFLLGTARPGSKVSLSTDIFGPMGEVISNVDGSWIFETPELSEGQLEVTASADGSAESSPLGITVDTTSPTVSVEIAIEQANPASSGPVEFQAEFNEAVSSFSSDDVSTGGSVDGVITVTGGGADYRISIAVPSNEGFVTASIPEGVVTDIAGNLNSASSSTTNRIDLDSHGGNGDAATPVTFSSSAAHFGGFITVGDSDTFAFTLLASGNVVIFTRGLTDTRGELRSDGNVLLNNPDADDNAGEERNFQIAQPLPAGNYQVSVTTEDVEGEYDLFIGTENPQPDISVGGRGNNIYGTPVGQTTNLISKKARPVSSVTTLSNDGVLSDTFSIRAAPGSGLFRVTYTNPDDGNITAALAAGTHQTAMMSPDDVPYRILVRIDPNKRRIKKKKVIRKGGQREKGIVYLKKRYLIRITAASDTLDTQTDLGDIRVQTK